MKSAIRSSAELLHALGLDRDSIAVSCDAETQFPVFVPKEFLCRMKTGDPHDPLLLQVLPRSQEANDSEDFLTDPVGDSNVEVVPGLLHKYEGRVLFILSGACAVHCRYCFRRHYPYQSAPKSLTQWEQALQYIGQNPDIHEVILSGGDPLTIADERLEPLIRRLDAIPHLRRLRIHTRFPVVIPQRVDRNLCHLLESSRLAKWMVLHINHANEIDSDLVAAIQRLRAAGVTLLNQAVLLKDVNDSADALATLHERLVDVGVTPYYLHQLDRVKGAEHFEVEPNRGLELIAELQKRLPGYAVPKYVLEVPGRPSKTPMADLTIEFA
jgi:L-lysine 2,3-aminomutase